MGRTTRRFAGALFVCVLAHAGLTEAGAFGAPGGSPPPQADFGLSHRKVCQSGPPDTARCHADVVTEADAATPAATVSYQRGLTPDDLASAYKYRLPRLDSSWTWNGRTIAIVDGFHYPSAEADLAAYRSNWRLPPCTVASGCLQQVNQKGSTAVFGSPNLDWAREAALDLDMASAVCPNCKLVLVEATTNSWENLFAAVDTAANIFHPDAISNSYGSSEFSSETTFESHYNHPGSAITVSSGDNGFGVEFPAASQFVTAVGGTSLAKDTSTSRGWTETAWTGAGSGCSAFVAKPAWQHDTGCAKRTVADVSAVADPKTGVAVYDSFGTSGGANWLVLGGTSVAAPIVAGIYALAGNGPSVTYGSFPYSHTSSLFDVVSGGNGSCWRGKAYLCIGDTGYDGPTGLGTPNGTSGF